MVDYDFELVDASVHVDQRDKNNPDKRTLVFKVEAKWLQNPECIAAFHVKAEYNAKTKNLAEIGFRGEPEVPVATPLPPWFSSYTKHVSSIDWASAAPLEKIKGLDAFFKNFSGRGN